MAKHSSSLRCKSCNIALHVTDVANAAKGPLVLPAINKARKLADLRGRSQSRIDFERALGLIKLNGPVDRGQRYGFTWSIAHRQSLTAPAPASSIEGNRV